MKVIEKKCNNIGAIIARVNSSGPKVIVPSSSLFSVLFKGNMTNPSLFRYHLLGNHFVPMVASGFALRQRDLSTECISRWALVLNSKLK